jgi:hypothetical protein
MPAAGPFSLITGGLLGEQDPRDAIAQWSNENQRRNRAAVGLDANGNPLPPNLDANGNPVAPADPAAVATGTALAGSQQSPDQQPQATKTDPSLGALLMNLTQYQMREQGFNKAMGMGFAAFSQPRDREMVSKMFDVNEPDVNQIGQTEMNLASQTQGQDRANSIAYMINNPKTGPAIAAKLHMDWGALKAGILADPGMAGRIAQALGTPTDALRNLTQLQNMGGGAGGTASPELKDITSGVISGVAGQDNAPMIAAQKAWRDSHPGQPDTNMPWNLNDLASFKQWQANEASNEADRRTASSELVDKNEAALTLKGDLEELKDSPGLHSIMTTAGKRDIALKALNDGTVTDIPSMMARWGLTNDEAKAVALLRRIGGATTETAMKGMAGTGTRVTQAEVGPLKDAISMTQNLNQSYEDYVHGAINNAITKTKRTVAANYGSTGNVKNMDPEFAPWLNDTFKKGGQLYKEGSGADDLTPAQPIPTQEIADGKELLAAKPYLRDEMLDNWQQRGFDTSKLRGKNPKNW